MGIMFVEEISDFRQVIFSGRTQRNYLMPFTVEIMRRFVSLKCPKPCRVR